MKITDNLIKQITETKYLTVDNSWRYRVIVRFFYEQFEQINYMMYKEDVYNELVKYQIFEGYTLEQCSSDLDSLVNWGNLIAVQDTTKVQTIEEFKNKKYRYEISRYSIEIERLTLRLETLKVEGASLEPSLLERIKLSLKSIEEMIYKEERYAFEWWNDLLSDFERLNTNYQDYIKQIYSLKPDEMMNTNAFLIFKEKLIEYLRDFIKALQLNIYDIENIMSELNQNTELKLLNKIVSYSLNIPRLEVITYDEIMENVTSRWRNLKRWFVGEKDRESEVEKLFDITNEIIRRLTRYAAQLSESMVSSVNRKEDYKNLCEMFLSCSNVDEAHRLSAYVFGLENMRHVQCDIGRKTESVNSGVFDEEAFEVIVKPRIRNYKEKVARYSIKDKTKEKAEIINRILEQRREQDELINKYIINDEIKFDSLGYINQYVRITLLTWLSNILCSSDFSSKNENGKIIRLINPKENKMCLVKCEDGDFQMPAFILKIEGL